MNGQAIAAVGDLSVAAATISASAIAATVAGEDDTGIPGSVILARSAIRFAPRPAGNAEQAGDRRTHDEDPGHPDKNLAQILAPSAVDTLKGNQR